MPSFVTQRADFECDKFTAGLKGPTNKVRSVTVEQRRTEGVLTSSLVSLQVILPYVTSTARTVKPLYGSLMSGLAGFQARADRCLELLLGRRSGVRSSLRHGGYLLDNVGGSVVAHALRNPRSYLVPGFSGQQLILTAPRRGLLVTEALAAPAEDSASGTVHCVICLRTEAENGLSVRCRWTGRTSREFSGENATTLKSFYIRCLLPCLR